MGYRWGENGLSDRRDPKNDGTGVDGSLVRLNCTHDERLTE